MKIEITCETKRKIENRDPYHLASCSFCLLTIALNIISQERQLHFQSLTMQGYDYFIIWLYNNADETEIHPHSIWQE